MILCAGLGTRLRPLTEWCAKPLVPIGDRPALAHILDRLVGARTVVNAHHRAADIEAFARGRSGDVLVSVEAELLGTAGGVAHASALLGGGDILVWNGDILVDLDPAELLRAHRGEATLVVRPGPRGAGNVGTDASGRIVRLRQETTSLGEVRGGEYVGVHLLGGALRALLPPRGCLVGELFLPALRRGATLTVFESARPFRDFGSPASYLRANLEWLDGRDGWASEEARVASSVRLQASVVGARAEVTGAGALHECVVWPNARVQAPLARSVVTPFGSLEALEIR